MNSHQKGLMYEKLGANITKYRADLLVYGANISTKKVAHDLDKMLKEAKYE